jgi:hypothetical protein
VLLSSLVYRDKTVEMPSLTPQYRAGEATDAAMADGLLAGASTLFPSSLAVWAATHNKKFLRVSGLIIF